MPNHFNPRRKPATGVTRDQPLLPGAGIGVTVSIIPAQAVGIAEVWTAAALTVADGAEAGVGVAVAGEDGASGVAALVVSDVRKRASVDGL